MISTKRRAHEAGGDVGSGGKAKVAAFDDNHGADRATGFSFAQAPAAAVVQGVQQ